MSRAIQDRTRRILVIALAVLVAGFAMSSQTVSANTPPEPVVAIHVSELTQALESMPAAATTPSGPGTTGYEWWTAEWHYFVGHDSLKEALRSDGTPFVEVSDADIAAGKLLYADGTPRYPIVISLAAEAVADNELSPLRQYVSAGGFLFVGSSAFTRNPDGTTRGDFAVAGEMGVHMSHSSLRNWYENLHFSKTADHRLVSHVPAGTIAWRMPLSAEEIPLGTALNHSVHGSHWVFQVYASTGTTVIANGDSGPLLASREYGNGNFIYHGAMQPLVGHTVYDPSMYAYVIYRHAIEWAFESAGLPLIRLSPLRYDYNGAFVVRHDCENNQDTIRAIEASAAYDKSAGGKSDFYFCTGTLRYEMADRDTVVASLRRALTNSGATFGSHNGGLKNPVTSLSMSAFDYWHWGPDEVLDIRPSGYASGKAYAEASVSTSFQDIEGWLSGLDNGRAGCGSAQNCPRIWVAPYMNSTREDSKALLDGLSVKSMGTGEEKIGPYPHWALSYRTPGKRFSFVSEPTSDWYVGSEIPGAIEWGHTTQSMKAAVDFYYGLGAPVNLYGHQVSSDSTLIGQYVKYCASKSRMWAANAVGIADWWKARSTAVLAPAYSASGAIAVAQATVTGASDAGTAVDVVIPSGSPVNDVQVFLDDAPADPADYRFVGNTLKVRVGSSFSRANVQYTITAGTDNPVPSTTGLSPATATSGGNGFTLTVTGSGFIAGSIVRWNGADRPTTFVSTAQVTATISAGDIAASGSVQVTVFNPAPGGGTSNGQTFTISSIQGGTWTQTDWSGGAGQAIWADASRYDSASGIDAGVSGRISLVAASGSLFSDDFTRPAGTVDPLSPWVASMGTWTVTNGVLSGTGPASQYSYASLAAAPAWTDYTVQGRIQIPAGAFGGGIGGRVNASTGAHYGAWVYPTGSPGGSNLLKLWKFRSWTDIGAGVPMQQVSLPAVGTGWHTLQLTFTANRIVVSYDGAPMIDVTDSNFDSRAPYLSGGISADWWTWSLPYTISLDDISVTASTTYGSSGSLVSSAFDGGEGVQWQSVSWDASSGGSTSVCVRTRSADVADQLAGASWSDCYGASGSGFLSENRRWIQYQLGLATSDSAASPVFNEIRAAYTLGSSEWPVPVVSGLTPSSAAAGGAAFTLSVSGSNFINGSTVRWNGTDRATTFVSATRVTAAIAAADLATAGTATVTVFTPAPGGGTSNGQIFTITAADNPVPVTTGLTPSTAVAGGSAFTLSVAGNGFISGSTVRWNGTNRPTTFVSATQVTAAIGAADIVSAGTATVTIFTPAPGGGISNGQTFTIAAADNPVPVTTGLSPASVTAGGLGFTLTVNGNGFITGSAVRWNGTDRPTTFVSSSQLTAAIVAADIVSAGTAAVTVFTPAPGGGTSNGQTFTIAAADNPVPVATSLSPTSATAGGAGFTLSIAGSGFISGSTVRWNGSDRPTTFVSASLVTAAIAAADLVNAGTASVTVYTPAPGGGASNALVFAIDLRPVPSTTSINPASLTAGGVAFTLNVYGTGFVTDSVVQWNGSGRTTTFVSSTRLTAAIPASDIASAGTAAITVFTQGPGGGTSNAQTLTVNNPVPTASKISPASRRVGGAAFTLTVQGTGFNSSSVVQWNGANRATTFVSRTQLTAAIPASDIAAAGTAQVRVFNPAPGGGTSALRSLLIR